MFVVYRLVAASYVIGWNIYGYITIPTFGHHVTIVFYTNWSYLILGIHLSLALFVTLFHSARLKKNRRRWTERGSPTLARCNGLAARGTYTEDWHHELRDYTETLVNIETEVHNKKGTRKHRHINHNNNNECKAGKLRQRPSDRTSGPQMAGLTAAGEEVLKSRTHTHSPRVYRHHTGPNDVMGIPELCRNGTKQQGMCTEMPLMKQHSRAGRSTRSKHHHQRHREIRGQGARRCIEENPPSKFVSNASSARHSEHKVRDLSKNPPQGSEAAHIYEELLEVRAQIPDRPERPRRKRHHRVCHRTGRSVGFKYKSSNSSLDKIRHRRRGLAPERRKFEQEHKRESTQKANPIDGNPHVQHVKRNAACRARAHTTEHSKQPRVSYLNETGVARRRDIQPESRAKGNSMLPKASKKSVARVPARRILLSPDDMENDRRANQKSHGAHITKPRCAKMSYPNVTERNSSKVYRSQKAENDSRDVKAGNLPLTEPRQGMCQGNKPRRNDNNVKSVGTRTCAEDIHEQNAAGNSLSRDEVHADQSRDSGYIPCYVKFSWAIFNMAAVSGPTVTAVYFFILFPMLQREQPRFRAGILDINLHGVNSLIILMEMTISAIPVRLLHFIYPLLYGVVYVLFSLAYWGYDKENNVLYPVILDWNHPGITCAVVVVLVFVATPLFQLIWYGVYRLRLLVFSRIYQHSLPYRQSDKVHRNDETHV